MVRLPDAAGQLKNAPVKVLRGFFSGIGQLLLAAERFRAEEAQRERRDQDEQDGPPTGLDGEHDPDHMTTADYVRSAAEGGRRHKAADSGASARAGARKKEQAAGPRQFRSLDSTGNVRVLTPDMPAESSADDDQSPAATRPRPPARARKTDARKTKGIGEEKAVLSDAKSSAKRSAPAAEVDLPVPGYDGLSLASLRARLRNLDAAQVRTLLGHEKSAGNRADVVGMLERRIAKLEAARDAT